MAGTDLVSPHPIFVFDGYCVLCSTGASFIMRHDPRGKVGSSRRSPIGQAVYAHFGLPIDASYMLITPEGTLTKTPLAAESRRLPVASFAGRGRRDRSTGAIATACVMPMASPLDGAVGRSSSRGQLHSLNRAPDRQPW
jgi:hypothetical protein